MDEVAREVSSTFNVWYLDDATFGVSPSKVLEDVRRIVEKLGFHWIAGERREVRTYFPQPYLTGRERC